MTGISYTKRKGREWPLIVSVMGVHPIMQKLYNLMTALAKRLKSIVQSIFVSK